MRPEGRRIELVGQGTLEQDVAVCRELLPLVSRTFALSIEALPKSLRRPVRVAYLLCRVVDCIEDATGITPGRRQSLFDIFDAVMGNDAVSPETLELGFRGLSAGTGGLQEAELRLGIQAGSPLRVFRSLSVEDKEAIRPHVLEMSRGMREYTGRAPSAWGGIAIENLQDLERYCYFVAGTVGQLLTALFARFVGLPSLADSDDLRRQAISFGIGLQLVNIVKDVADDYQRGACFLPADLVAEHGLDLDKLLDPDQRQAGLGLIHTISARARHHLELAGQYTSSWPLPRGAPVRLFCAVPLGLALATLDEVERGDDALRPGRCPAVSRFTVKTLLFQAHQAVGSDEQLTRWLRSLRTIPSPS